jgi:formylglycine-generating enzyme required for sulfatase activity
MKPAAPGDTQPLRPAQPPLRLLRWQARTQVFHEELGGGARLPMVRIPAGSFQMGSADQELGRHANEGPLHQVTLAEFLIGQTPITQAQWRVVASWEPQKGERWGRELNPKPAKFQGEEARLLPGETNTDERPVERVSWDDAIEFCSRLSQRTKRNYTLPSEAQWEYACRAGTSTAFHFGPIILSDLANFKGTDPSRFNSLNIPDPQPLFREQTTPVGMFPANPWGLYDMHGNVWEWCLDSVRSSYEDGPYDGSAWVDSQATKALRKINRGGSWYMPPRFCRSAVRTLSRSNAPNGPYDDSGFRVACLPSGTSLNCTDDVAAGLPKQIDEPIALEDEAATMPTTIYFSYSHVDAKWLNKLQTTLAPMVRGGLRVCNDAQPGETWRDKVEWALEKTTPLETIEAAILLVSPSYLESDFITQKELPRLISAADERGFKILWVPVERCLYEITDITRYQAVFSPDRPLASLKPDELDEALVAICRAITAAI